MINMAFELLALADIKKQLKFMAPASFQAINLEILPLVDSTNAELVRRLNNQDIHQHCLLTEYQTNGKGRRENRWMSSYASGLCFSLGWHVADDADSGSYFSLFIAVVIVRCLTHLGYQGIGVKYPNDLIWDNKKLGGILLETRRKINNTLVMVIGVGINFYQQNIVVDQDIVDLNSINPAMNASRNVIATSLIYHIIDFLQEYKVQDNHYWLKEWERYNFYGDKHFNIENMQLENNKL